MSSVFLKKINFSAVAATGVCAGATPSTTINKTVLPTGIKSMMLSNHTTATSIQFGATCLGLIALTAKRYYSKLSKHYFTSNTQEKKITITAASTASTTGDSSRYRGYYPNDKKTTTTAASAASAAPTTDNKSRSRAYYLNEQLENYNKKNATTADADDMAALLKKQREINQKRQALQQKIVSIDVSINCAPPVAVSSYVKASSYTNRWSKEEKEALLEAIGALGLPMVDFTKNKDSLVLISRHVKTRSPEQCRRYIKYHFERKLHIKDGGG
jgi:hypothetical protein